MTVLPFAFILGTMEVRNNEDIIDRMIHRKDKSVVNYVLVAANIAIFIYAELTGGSENLEHMLELGAMYPPLVERGEYWRLFTSMFLHFGLAHLLSNMMLLFFLGDYMERFMGRVRYLILYLLGGVLASLTSWLHAENSGDAYVSAGASGAIYALVGGLVVLLIESRGKLEDLTLGRVLAMVVLLLAVSFQSEGIDAFAHLGGFLSGMVLTLLLGSRVVKRGHSSEHV